jgi:hypothetical protein
MCLAGDFPRGVLMHNKHLGHIKWRFLGQTITPGLKETSKSGVGGFTYSMQQELWFQGFLLLLLEGVRAVLHSSLYMVSDRQVGGSTHNSVYAKC